MATIDALLVRINESSASDLHLRSDQPPLMRRHGAMAKIQGHYGALTGEDITGMLGEIMPERNKAEFESVRDTDFAYEIEGLARFRVNVFEDRHGIGAVLRLIPSKILTVDDLKLPRAVVDFCFLSKGLVVVTGPTGSGKSTTLAAMVDHINRYRTDHIITIEDPIEFVHPSQRCLVTQREVGTHTRTFKAALRAALRENPDVILVGEMRDLETIAIAIEMAETGHLVFGTLHTTTAGSTVDRIVDQFPAGQQAQIRTMLAGSLKGVVAQTLLRKADGQGRVAAIELLVVTPGVSANIREGKTHAIPSAIQTGAKYGMVSLNDAILAHVLAGRVLPDEAYRKAVDKQEIVNRFASHSVPFDPASVAATEVEIGAPAAAEPAPASASGRTRPSHYTESGAAVNPYAPQKREVKKKVADDFEAFRQGRDTGRGGVAGREY